jgi:hypothetical protein
VQSDDGGGNKHLSNASQLIIYHIDQCNIIEYNYLHTHQCENLKSHPVGTILQTLNCNIITCTLCSQIVILSHVHYVHKLKHSALFNTMFSSVQANAGIVPQNRS